jgi:hypothetical protein
MSNISAFLKMIDGKFALEQERLLRARGNSSDARHPTTKRENHGRKPAKLSH